LTALSGLRQDLAVDFDANDLDRFRRAATLLRDAERPIRILRTLSWPAKVREGFFAAGAERLPEVEYAPPDPQPTFTALQAAREHIREGTAVDAWLCRQADAIEGSARMLAAVGTPELYTWARQLYGTPRDPLPDGTTTPLDLAKLLDETLTAASKIDLGAPSPACHLAQHVAAKMREAVAERFGGLAPEVVIVDELSSNALAGPKAIRVRRTACFTDRDVDQLIHHEAFIHVATSLNGQAQADLPILGAGHAGTTRTQEGLAVFAELMSTTLDPSRLLRLADRVIAIQMAVDGADFLDVYRYFVERTGDPDQSFESARRVFRGGVLSGGAPFTKDLVYLGGLLRVHNFLRSAVAAGRSDCVRLLFCGKLDIRDVPALAQLAAAGLCRPPMFLPPWAEDLRFLVSYLAYSAFLNRVDLGRLSARFAALLDETPRVRWA
jgi:uncharacterized protein (TIGR02421 family)